MNSSQSHALHAGAALSMASSATTLKPSNAKVALGKDLRIIVTDSVANRFHDKVRIAFRSDLVAGKLVVEVIPDPKSGTRSFTPLMPGQKVIQIDPTKVPGCGTTFPKFGMCPPDAVIWGRDNVLRITLPGKRPTLSPRRTKMATPKPRKKELVRKDLPVATKPVEPEAEKQDLRGVCLGYSRSNVRVYTNDWLARRMGSDTFRVSSITEEGTGTDHVVRVELSRNGPYRLGRKTDKGLQYLTLNGVDKFKPLYFRKSQISGMSADGDKLVFEVKGTLAPPIHRTKLGGKASAPATPKAAPDDWFTRLRSARDEINAIIGEASRINEKVELVVRENGTLGIRYEG
jgi:hypothetical protein